MTRKYAEGTTVTVSKTQGNIRKIVLDNSGKNFGYIEGDDMAVVAFQAEGQNVQLRIPISPLEDFMRTDAGHRRSVNKGECKRLAEKAREKEIRRRWRALFLIVKAKFEYIRYGDSSVRKEFLADIMLPDGQTMGDWALPQIDNDQPIQTMLSLPEPKKDNGVIDVKCKVKS